MTRLVMDIKFDVGLCIRAISSQETMLLDDACRLHSSIDIILHFLSALRCMDEQVGRSNFDTGFRRARQFVA